MEFKDLFKQTKKVTVRYGDHTFDVDYYPHRYDKATHLAIQEYRDGFDQDKLHAAIAKLVRGWSITNDGEPMPVTAETLAMFPTPLVVTMGTTIINDVWSNVKTDGADEEAANG